MGISPILVLIFSVKHQNILKINGMYNEKSPNYQI